MVYDVQPGNMVFYGSDIVRWIPQERRSLRGCLVYMVSDTLRLNKVFIIFFFGKWHIIWQ